jgi:hypothetical protein
MWGRNIQMDRKEIACLNVGWIDLSRNGDQWPDFGYKVMKLGVSSHVGSVLWRLALQPDSRRSSMVRATLASHCTHLCLLFIQKNKRSFSSTGT